MDAERLGYPFENQLSEPPGTHGPRSRRNSLSDALLTVTVNGAKTTGSSTITELLVPYFATL